jgi:hypothetical protein
MFAWACFLGYAVRIGTGESLVLGIPGSQGFVAVRRKWVDWARSSITNLLAYKRQRIVKKPLPLFPATGGLLPFGSTQNTNYLCWRTKGRVDDWYVVMWDSSSLAYQEFPGKGLGKFFLELLDGTSELLQDTSWREWLSAPSSSPPNELAFKSLLINGLCLQLPEGVMTRLATEAGHPSMGHIWGFFVPSMSQTSRDIFDTWIAGDMLRAADVAKKVSFCSIRRRGRLGECHRGEGFPRGGRRPC